MSTGLKTALLLGALSGLLILAGGAIGGQGGIVIAFVIAVVMNVGSYWFSDKIVLRMYRAQEVGPDHPLYAHHARGSPQKAGLPMPKVYVIPDMSPNAFATGRSPNHAAVAATEGILRLLPENELEGVIAHELTHVKHRDILISTHRGDAGRGDHDAREHGALCRVLRRRIARRPRGRPNPLALLAMVILAPFAAMLIQMAISRQREFAADRGGAELVGSPTGLASALRHIDAAVEQIPLDANPATAHLFIMNPFTRDGMMSLFQSHPPTEARIKALMER